MKKNQRIIMLALTLLILVLYPVSHAQNSRVIDDADMFTPEEEEYIEKLISNFQKETGMDFVVYTSNEAHKGKSGIQYGEDFFDENGYGLGDKHSGIIYFIDMNERYPYLITSGDMIDYMTDSRMNHVLSGITSELRNGDYLGSVENAVKDVLAYKKAGIPEGQYRYDPVTGKVLTERHKVLTTTEIFVCALIGLSVCLVLVLSVNHGYSLKGSTYSYYYRENGGYELTDKLDDFIRTTRTRMPKSQPQSVSGGPSRGSGKGSATHAGSSGVSHGGGKGGHF